eukprot:scaffold141921_cov20-Tisochrysis_lutea.AAC.1
MQLLGLLGLVFVIAGLGHYKFGPLLNGPLISICVGIAFSAIVVYGGATQSYTSILRFKPEIFLYVLLVGVMHAFQSTNLHQRARKRSGFWSVVGMDLGCIMTAVMCCNDSRSAGITKAHATHISVANAHLPLQPTIITDGALNVDVHLFLLNFGTICNTAFLGTTISAFIIGVLQWGFGQAKICYAMPFLPNLVSDTAAIPYARWPLQPQAEQKSLTLTKAAESKNF